MNEEMKLISDTLNRIADAIYNLNIGLTPPEYTQDFVLPKVPMCVLPNPPIEPSLMKLVKEDQNAENE